MSPLDDTDSVRPEPWDQLEAKESDAKPNDENPIFSKFAEVNQSI